MKTDIEIAHSIKLKKISDVAKEIGIEEESVIPYGRYMAKIPYDLIDEKSSRKGKLILVTAITPTKAGIGKTTVSIGLALGLNKAGKKAVVALREPSLGPCFGMKGGAAGGGYAQVLPMENINLHFTGDFHAITAANNMISALLDNYIYQNRDKADGIKQVLWRRVLDVNDRSLRQIITGLGGTANGVPTETGFDITPASEIMAILCLAENLDDLKRRIEKILLGYTYSGKPFTVKDLGVAGSIVVLLKDALNPNLVQTTEHTPAFVHGGPFANIAHGCNSVVATKMGLSFADYVVTEAGFGADLGAEKFLNIKCRKAGIKPSLSVLVVTTQALKMHGGVDVKDIKLPNAEGLVRGFENMNKHIENLRSFGQKVLVAFNKYGFDTDEEIKLLREHCEQQGVGFAVNDAFAKGGEGAMELAEKAIKMIEQGGSSDIRFTYEDTDSVRQKIEKIAVGLYGAKRVLFSKKALAMIPKIEELGAGKYPVCIAKTQYSFSEDEKAYGVARDFDFTVNDLVINNGAEFIVAIAGNIMRMPGLPKEPQAKYIDLIDGEIVGLS
ncbi:formate--tetrahydrofolate ligase [Paludibacter sp. 221]|uniref:formate--tetrahydrofolate ligase n=1 Tax=Paludibacter sp. 221 TaxID=2302939 RepID=UPI0013CF4640|nr:formate--tetrahydrofolate ligase [Paludibacter sp. 221]NDV47216.1 formate--tetrahydrofolate ligase [Paludibacter sp. 221]